MVNVQSTTTPQALIDRQTLRRALPAAAQRRALRLAANLTLDDVAGLIGCTRQAVSNWESGRREPSGRFLQAYTEALQVARRLA